MRRKFYLEPRSNFDECISEETSDHITYNVQNIIALLADEFAKEDSKKLDRMDYIYMAQEWFDYSIKPLESQYNLLFTSERSPHVKNLSRNSRRAY